MRARRIGLGREACRAASFSSSSLALPVLGRHGLEVNHRLRVEEFSGLGLGDEHALAIEARALHEQSVEVGAHVGLLLHIRKVETLHGRAELERVHGQPVSLTTKSSIKSI